MSLTCKHCDFPIAENFYFCPNCGKKLKQPPLSTGILRQIYIYGISALLPPLGLWPGIKYLMQPTGKAKIIGLIAIILTVLSIALTIKIAMDILSAQIAIANQQLQLLEGVGY